MLQTLLNNSDDVFERKMVIDRQPATNPIRIDSMVLRALLPVRELRTMALLLS